MIYIQNSVGCPYISVGPNSPYSCRSLQVGIGHIVIIPIDDHHPSRNWIHMAQCSRVGNYSWPFSKGNYLNYFTCFLIHHQIDIVD